MTSTLPTEKKSAEKQSAGKRTGARGARDPKPKIAVRRESPRKKVSFEIKEDTATLIEGYARFLSSHHGFAVTPGAVIESLAEDIESDALFQAFLIRAPQTGAPPPATPHSPAARSEVRA